MRGSDMRLSCLLKRHFLPTLLLACLVSSPAFGENMLERTLTPPGATNPLGTNSSGPSSFSPGMGASASTQGILYPNPAYATGGVMPDALAPPAWAQGPYPGNPLSGLPPFGASLFQGNFSASFHDGFNPGYPIQPGDRIAVRIWGSKTYDDILVVDQQGNIFFPEMGPMRVAGLTNSQLQNAAQQQIASIFTGNVNIYANLLSAQPVSVFVTGHVNKPGRYAGGLEDPILYYLDRAGGINPERGSYREVVVKRGGKTLATIDLYSFLLQGTLPAITLTLGDVILIREKGMSVASLGLVRQPARYEFLAKSTKGSELIPLVSPMPNATHVSVTGTRSGAPFHAYLAMPDFAHFSLQDGDAVEFTADNTSTTIMVSAAGAIEGASRFPVKKGTTLKQLLAYIPIQPDIADISSVYIQRRSVAQQQKRTLLESLQRLEQSTLTASMVSAEEAGIKAKEAELVQNFVARARNVEPNGVLVVSRGNTIEDVMLEEGDIIYFPQKSDVVLISGEVMMPKAVAFASNLSLTDYIKNAGGYSERANKSTVLLARPNGEVLTVSGNNIQPGDQIIVMPSYTTKSLPIIKDLTTLIYQIAVSARIALGL